MLTRLDEVETKIDEVLGRMVALRSERDRLAVQLGEAREVLARHQRERDELRARVDGLLAELEALEGAIRGSAGSGQ